MTFKYSSSVDYFFHQVFHLSFSPPLAHFRYFKNVLHPIQTRVNWSRVHKKYIYEGRELWTWGKKRETFTDLQQRLESYLLRILQKMFFILWRKTQIMPQELHNIALFKITTNTPRSLDVWQLKSSNQNRRSKLTIVSVHQRFACKSIHTPWLFTELVAANFLNFSGIDVTAGPGWGLECLNGLVQIKT